MSKLGVMKGLMGSLDVGKTLQNVTEAIRVEEAKVTGDEERVRALKQVEEQVARIQVPEILQTKPGKPVPNENVSVQVTQRNPQTAEVSVKVSPEKK